MAAKKKTIVNENKPAIPPPVAPADPQVRALPFAVRRELEEITKNTGRTFDLNAPLEVLEDICNNANQPRSAWRTRWE